MAEKSLGVNAEIMQVVLSSNIAIAEALLATYRSISSEEAREANREKFIKALETLQQHNVTALDLLKKYVHA